MCTLWSKDSLIPRGLCRGLGMRLVQGQEVHVYWPLLTQVVCANVSMLWWCKFGESGVFMEDYLLMRDRAHY